MIFSIKIKALSDESEPISIISNNYEEVLDVSKFNEKERLYLS